MPKIPQISRILLGLIFFIFGLNGFLNFIPVPPNLPEKLVTFNQGMKATGYFFPLLTSTEVICAVLLLANLFVPLALVILAPIIVNIFCVHLFMAPEGLPVALVIGGLELYLAFFSPYSPRIKALFTKEIA